MDFRLVNKYTLGDEVVFVVERDEPADYRTLIGEKVRIGETFTVKSLIKFNNTPTVVGLRCDACNVGS